MVNLCPDFSNESIQCFFSPTYRSIIPQIVAKSIYRHAIGLSAATYQLLGVLDPGLAGILAIWLGAREIFFIDAATFVIAGVLYPLAGFLGTSFPNQSFLFGGIITLAVLLLVVTFLRPKNSHYKQ